VGYQACNQGRNPKEHLHLNASLRGLQSARPVRRNTTVCAQMRRLDVKNSPLRCRFIAASRGLDAFKNSGYCRPRHLERPLMQSAQRLIEKVNRREMTLGLLVTQHLWLDLVEIATRSSLDYLILDMEHGVADVETVADMCAVGRMTDFPILIRPQNNQYTTLRLAMDLGCCGFLLASVESAADLDGIRDAIRVPPRGRRRPGGPSNRWLTRHTQPDWKAGVEDSFIVLPQIETRVGLSNVDAIAGHEVTTSIAVGPYDLSAELGVCGEQNHPKVRQALATIRKAGAAHRKEMWMIGDATQLAADGYHFICMGEPSWLLEGALRQKAAEARTTKANA
jgi:2-keto-3-deoxy-L-rhamnonate aldolase RhmA